MSGSRHDLIALGINDLARARVPRKRVPDSLRGVLSGLKLPSLNLEPIASRLIDDLVRGVTKLGVQHLGFGRQRQAMLGKVSTGLGDASSYAG